jgi:hypothetical protein
MDKRIWWGGAFEEQHNNVENLQREPNATEYF